MALVRRPKILRRGVRSRAEMAELLRRARAPQVTPPPFVTSVLDAFNRANENPLGTGFGWGTGGISALTVAQLVSNQAQGTGTFSGAWWATAFNAKQEVFLDIAAIATRIVLYACISNPATSPTVNGYELSIAPTTWTLFRITAGSTLSIATGSTTFAAGDGAGFTVGAAGLITAWRRHNGVWAVLGSGIDTTWSTGGFIGFSTQALGTDAVDNFGGGNSVTVANVFLTPTAGETSLSADTTTSNALLARGPTETSVSTDVAGRVKPLLIGSTVAPSSNPDTVAAGVPFAFAFTALQTGVVDTLSFLTNSVANTGVTSVQLGIYSDNAGAPGTLLGSGTFSGTPATSSRFTVSGLSIPVTAGTPYWIAELSLGGAIHWNDSTNGVGGNNEVLALTTGQTTLPTPFGTLNGGAFFAGPWGIQATGAGLLLARTGAETSASSDTAVAAKGVSRTGTETSTSTDTIAFDTLLARTAPETSASTDSAARAPATLARTGAETSASTDTAVAAKGVSRTGTETSISLDTDVRAPQAFARTVAETSVSTDTAARAAPHSRTAAETSVSTAAIVSHTLLARGPTETSNASDTTGRTTSFVLDSFTDSSGTLLSAHVGEVGATWVRSPGDTFGGNPTIQSNQLVGDTGGSGGIWGFFYASGIPATADYSVSADLGSGAVVEGILGRMDTATLSGYWLNWTAGTLTLFAMTNLVTQVTLGTAAVSVPARITLKMTGTTITALVNGVSVISVTDATWTAKGRAGVATHAGAQDNFLAAETWVLARTAAETSASTDAAVSAKGVSRTSTETSVSLDTDVRAPQALPRTTTETSVSTDTATRVEALPRTGVETSASSDATTVLRRLFRTAAETNASTDVAARAPSALARTGTETSVSTATATRTLPFGRTSSETSASTDTATRSLPLSRTATETSVSTSTATRALTLFRIPAETSVSADSTSVIRILFRTAAETSLSSAVAAIGAGGSRTAAETSSSTDTATRSAPRARTATETSLSTDAAARSAALLPRTSTETSTSADSAARAAGALARTATETSVSTATATRSLPLPRTAAEVSTVFDTAVLPIIRRSAAETSVSVDLAHLVGGGVRTAFETSVNADSTAVFRSFFRTSAETSVASDTAAPAVALSRSATETSTSVDSVVVVYRPISATWPRLIRGSADMASTATSGVDDGSVVDSTAATQRQHQSIGSGPVLVSS